MILCIELQIRNQLIVSSSVRTNSILIYSNNIIWITTFQRIVSQVITVNMHVRLAHLSDANNGYLLTYLNKGLIVSVAHSMAPLETTAVANKVP